MRTYETRSCSSSNVPTEQCSYHHHLHGATLKPEDKKDERYYYCITVLLCRNDFSQPISFSPEDSVLCHASEANQGTEVQGCHSYVL